jgi:hypothetical protein
LLKTDACAALAAIMIIADAHSELMAWGQRMVLSRSASDTKKANGAKPASCQARRRAERDADDQRLLEAMRDAPGRVDRRLGEGDRQGPKRDRSGAASPAGRRRR